MPATNLSLACLCALLALAGCASPKGKFQTRKDSSYNAKLGKLLLVYYAQDTSSTLGRDFSARFAQRANALLSERNVPTEIIRLEREALDRNAPLRAAVVRFQPRQFLWFVVTRVDS